MFTGHVIDYVLILRVQLNNDIASGHTYKSVFAGDLDYISARRTVPSRVSIGTLFSMRIELPEVFMFGFPSR